MPEQPDALPVLVAAGVLVKQGSKVLLQGRSDDGSWGLPGGALKGGETLEEAARRELLEETGLQVGRLELVDVYSGSQFQVSYPDGFRAYVVGATYITVEFEGVLRIDGVETTELAWFDEHSLPSHMNTINQNILRRVGLEGTS